MIHRVLRARPDLVVVSIALIAGGLGLATFDATSGPAAATAAPALDHFECYSAAATTTSSLRVSFGATPRQLLLKNRFAQGGFKAALGKVQMQCSPTQETVRVSGRSVTTPIMNPTARLVCWSMTANGLKLPPSLSMQNEFGTGLLKPTAARSLCMPSWRSATLTFPATTAPSNLDSYACFSAIEPAGASTFALPPSATLKDEYGTKTTKVGAPNMVCLPTLRGGAAGGWTKVVNATNYTVCFALPAGSVPSRTNYGKDQFGIGAVRVSGDTELCVPSVKAAVTPTTTTTMPDTTTTTPNNPGGAAPALHVVGNHLVTSSGTPVQLRGVNRPGPEYAAAEGDGVFDGPTDDNASIEAIKSWNVNAVRVPLNEDSWLGINGVNPAFNGAPYRAAIVDYVNRLNAEGIVAIVNLHFSAPGTTVPDDQSPMADEDHSPAFWQSVASTFADNHSVIFDVFNEPYPDNNLDTATAWSCVLNGGTCSGVSYPTAGMQQLVDVIRAAGATQPLMIAGPQYAGELDQWMAFEPADPLHQLIASVHIYGLPLDSPYRVSSTWDTYIAPLAAQVPIVIGEFGDTDCTSNFSTPLMTWADAHGISYLAWGWITSNCASEPALITDYNGTPTPFGAGVRAHLLQLAKEW